MDGLEDLSRQFLSCSPIKGIHLQSMVDITWDEQKQLLLKTVLHPLVVQYPLSYPYQRSFLRSVIHLLEGAGVDVHDEVYETYTSLLGASTTEYVYKHYVLEGQTTVSLKESSRLISDGTTGLHSWEAALVLAEWCLQNKDKLRDKCVVELGSGAGLTGLTVAKCCSPKSLWMTDCHPTVLSLLKDNLELNFVDSDNSNEKVDHVDGRVISKVETDVVEVGVMNVSWEDIPTCWHAPALPRPQVLLAADVVYDSSLFPALCGALSHFLHSPQSQSPPLALLVCTVRNEGTLSEFMRMLGSHKIRHKEMNIPTAIHFYNDIGPDDPPVRILQLLPH